MESVLISEKESSALGIPLLRRINNFTSNCQNNIIKEKPAEAGILTHCEVGLSQRFWQRRI